MSKRPRIYTKDNGPMKKRSRFLVPYQGVAARQARTGGFLGLEYKFLDCAWNGVALATSTDGSGGELQPSSGCTNAISVPAQGDGESNRDGRKYVITSAYFNGIVDTTPLSDQTDVVDFGGYFFALVLDTQANGATVNSEDVYVNPSTSAIAMMPKPLRNLQNSTRFRVLDSIYVAPPAAYAGTDGANTMSLSTQNQRDVTLSWKGELQVTCVGTTADVAAVSDNALHIIAYATTIGNAPKLYGKSRIRFQG